MVAKKKNHTGIVEEGRDFGEPCVPLGNDVFNKMNVDFHCSVG